MDLYSGEVYRNLPIQNFDGIAFDNFSYSCSDTALYGLIRKNYFSTEFDSTLGFPIETLDSATVRLGKINLTTGDISIVSPYSIVSGGYSLNAGSTIDPSTDTYYFSNGDQIIGVNLYTGITTTNPNLNYEEGMYFDLMRNFGDCRNALRTRQNPATTGINNVNASSALRLFPNPANEFINLQLDANNQLISITDLTGKIVLRIQSNGNSQLQIPVNQLSEGMYLVSINAKQHAKLLVKH